MSTATAQPTLTDHPTFIDLKAFASEAANEVTDDPFGEGRAALPLREAPVEVGAIRLGAGSGTVRGIAGDTFLVGVSGKAQITATGTIADVGAGQACVITSDTAFSWSASEPSTLLYMRYLAGQGSDTGVVPVDLNAELVPSGAPLAELLVGDTPACRNHTDFGSADGEFTCGVWDSTPYHRLSMPYRHFELMVLLRGSVTFVDERGENGTFSKDDIFLVEQGAQCSWDSREVVAKIYAIYRPLT